MSQQDVMRCCRCWGRQAGTMVYQVASELCCLPQVCFDPASMNLHLVKECCKLTEETREPGEGRRQQGMKRYLSSQPTIVTTILITAVF